jgi:hypothetical protein
VFAVLSWSYKKKNFTAVKNLLKQGEQPKTYSRFLNYGS